MLLPLQYFESVLEDTHLLISKCLIEFTCEAIGSWAFVFCEIFVYSFDLQLVIGLFKISISSWFSLGRLNFSKNLPISSRLSILLPYSCS